MLKLQSRWSCYCDSSLSTALPILFCCPALWIQGLLSARKAPEFWYGSLWLCSTEGFIFHNLLKTLLQKLPKIPLVRNAIMRRSGCFLTHTVSLKRFFFFFKQMFSRRIQRFSKVTAKTEQLIILFLKGLSLHRRFLYLKMLEMLRFTILLHCIWPLGWEEVGSGCIKRSQQDRAHQVLRRKAASLQASPGHRPWTYQSSPGLVAIVMNVLAISDQDWGNLIIRVIFRNAYYSSGQCYHKVSLKSWLRWCCASGGIKSVSDLNRIDQYYRKLTCIYGRPSTSLV